MRPVVINRFGICYMLNICVVPLSQPTRDLVYSLSDFDVPDQ